MIFLGAISRLDALCSRTQAADGDFQRSDFDQTDVRTYHYSDASSRPSPAGRVPELLFTKKLGSSTFLHFTSFERTGLAESFAEAIIGADDAAAASPLR